MIATTNIFGAIAILLLITLVDTSSAQESGVPPEAYPEQDIGDPENFLFEVNAYRLKYAKENNIPFMNKLTWNQSLAYNAGSISTDWSIRRIGVRYAHITDYRDVEEHIERRLRGFKMIAVTAHPFDQYKDSSGDELELLIPFQSQIGCIERSRAERSLLCLLGPSDIFWTPLVNRDYRRGNPGTRCEPGFENENGLCATVKKTKSLRPTPASVSPDLRSHEAQHPANFDSDSVAASKFSGCFLVMTTIFTWYKWN